MNTRTLLLALLVLASLPTVAQEDEGNSFFSLSTSETFAPEEEPRVSVSASRVKQLEFRLYRVNDPVVFFEEKLQDEHQFGGQAPRNPKDRTTLEKLYSWKRGLRARWRDLFREQYQPESRHQIRAMMTPAPKPEAKQATAPDAATRFAAIPLLNQQQLVARWSQSLASDESYYSEQVKLPKQDVGLYVLEATDGKLQAYTVLSVTQLAILAKGAPGRVVARILDRDSGAPKANVPVIVLSKDRKKRYLSGNTNAQGMIEAAVNEEQLENVLVLARDGRNFAVAGIYGYNISQRGARDLAAYIYTDRPVYRPGDTVQYRMILRSRGERGYALPPTKSTQMEIHDGEDNVVQRATLNVSSFGTVHGEYKIPAAAPLGYYSVQYKLDDDFHTGGFQVEEYKKPEYEVRVTPSEKRVLQGKAISAAIDARFYFGEPVANAKLTYVVHQSRYWPPYYEMPEDDERGPDDYYSGEQILEQEGQLDAEGKLTVSIPTKQLENDVRLRIEARVTDEAGREISGAGSVIATVGSYFLNARPAKYVFAPNEPVELVVEAKDYDGNAVPNVTFQVALGKQNYRERKFESFNTTTGRTGADGVGRVTMPGRGGSLLARVTSQTPEGRTVKDDSYVWVSGSFSYEGGESIRLVPDKRSYAAGETAKVLVAGVPDGAHIWLTTEGKTLTSSRYLQMANGSLLVDVPVTGDMAPNFFVSAAAIVKGKLYSASKTVKVPPVQHTLNVALEASKPQFLPGEPGTYTLTARDAAGRGVAGEFSLGIVDEAIYAIRREPQQELLSFFYGRDYNRVGLESSLSYYFSGEAGKRRMQLARIRPWATRAQLKPERLIEPKVRKAFPDTMFWSAEVRTDGAGRAKVNVQFPDALTLWRATARGITADSKVGTAVLKTVVRKNLITRLAAPRFLRDGDTVTLVAIAQNFLPKEKKVRMVLEATGVDLLDPATQDVTVASRGTATMNVRVKPKPGTEAVFTVKALTDEESDAMETRLPVVPLGVKLSESKAGSLADGGNATAVLNFPADAIGHSRTLDVTVSPSVAGAIFGALEYLTSFPYGCTEQTMSSFLPNVLVSESLRTLGVESRVDKAELEKKIRAGIERLSDFQHEDGGWGWWQADDSAAFMTAYVVAGWAQAKAAGHAIPEERLQNGVAWLAKNIDTKISADLRAYAVYAMALAGKPPAALVNSLANDQRNLSPYGLALYGLALDAMKDARADAVAQALAGRVSESGAEAFWKADRDTLMDFEIDASPEATAYAMKLLARRTPSSPLLPKAALYLVNHRNEGYWWSSTKQTAMVIYGLLDYLKASGELKPDFTVKVESGGRVLIEKRFTAADALAPTPTTLRIPAAQLPAGAQRLTITQAGKGRLYWSARAEAYAPAANLQRTGSIALNAVRELFKLVPEQSGGKIVHRLEPLRGPVANGDVLASRVTVSGGEWRYLMIEDPIPSGCENIERDNLYEVPNRPGWWGWGFTRRELRDDRAVYFQTWFDGQQEFFHLMKVVNAGQFGVSPVRVEPMYQPQKFATSGTANVEVQ
ncbi:MAG: alpha-2-macroglobulin [Bryobacterales bacterium]|nr:alpha-2-macroglobulin [Bryobacterales bacterium]